MFPVDVGFLLWKSLTHHRNYCSLAEPAIKKGQWIHFIKNNNSKKKTQKEKTTNPIEVTYL